MASPKKVMARTSPAAMVNPTKAKPTQASAAAHQIEGEVGPGTPGEGLMPDALGHRLDAGGLLLGDGERHLPTHQAHAEPAVLGLLGSPHASRRCNRTAPSQMTATV